MRAIKLPNGRLLMPKRAEGPNRMIGDGMVKVGPEDPEYEPWLQFAEDDAGGHDCIPAQTAEALDRLDRR
jgi:hypothetical protein